MRNAGAGRLAGSRVPGTRSADQAPAARASADPARRLTGRTGVPIFTGPNALPRAGWIAGLCYTPAPDFQGLQGGIGT